MAFGPYLVHGLRNAGAGPAILLLTGVYADDEPPFQFVEVPAAGTPTVGTPAP